MAFLSSVSQSYKRKAGSTWASSLITRFTTFCQLDRIQWCWFPGSEPPFSASPWSDRLFRADPVPVSPPFPSDFSPCEKVSASFPIVHIEHPSAQSSKKEENVQNKFEASIAAWFKVFVHNALLQWFFQHLISKNNPQNRCPPLRPLNSLYLWISTSWWCCWWVIHVGSDVATA